MADCFDRVLQVNRESAVYSVMHQVTDLNGDIQRCRQELERLENERDKIVNDLKPILRDHPEYKEQWKMERLWRLNK